MTPVEQPGAEIQAALDALYERSCENDTLTYADARVKLRALLARLEAAEDTLNGVTQDFRRVALERDAARGEGARLRRSLERAAYLADHLHAMVDGETWRASGGDDGQGHYEGDYRAEQVLEEIRALEALAQSDGQVVA